MSSLTKVCVLESFPCELEPVPSPQKKKKYKNKTHFYLYSSLTELISNKSNEHTLHLDLRVLKNLVLAIKYYLCFTVFNVLQLKVINFKFKLSHVIVFPKVYAIEY